MDSPLILASASPRRHALLRLLGIEFEVRHADIDESVLQDEDAELYVKRLAAAKAQTVYQAACQEGLNPPVLGADTTVVCQQEILGKPEGFADAKRILMRLSGRWHQVYTAVSLCGGEPQEAWPYAPSQEALRQEALRQEALRQHAPPQETIVVCSQVKFRELTNKDIEWYWNTGEPIDKAGAYGIQGHGGLFVERIDGSYSSIVGLPLCETTALLNRFGIDLGTIA